MSSADPRYLEVRLSRASLRRDGRQVLRDVSWVIRPGERWVLAGGNGAGKTQLLKLLAGVVWPAPRRPPPLRYRLGTQEATTPFGLKEDIAYLGAERQDQYQRYGWNSPAARVVGTGLEHSDIPLERLTSARRRRIRAVLAALGATHLAPRPFLSLSYGERRLVLLARALVSRPRLLLLDEVLNGLDAPNRARILRWLARARRLPWVHATHRLADLPRGATHALVLNRGRVMYAGPLRNAPLSRWLAVRDGAPIARRPRGSRARRLVRLTRARVYLEQHRALSGLSLAVHAGEVWIVHGRNGSGKTTLLRTLYGDCGVAAGGSVERVRAAPGVPLERFKRRVGLIAPHLHAEHPRELTVTEVVRSGRHASIGLAAKASAADRAAARRALTAFGLTRLAARRFGELSYGQSRRVLFARAWASEPELLLLDEPFAGIDAPTRHALTQRVLALSARSAAIVLATHRPEEWRDSATHELELTKGRARYCGPVRAARAADRAARAPARSGRSRA
jgi:molybdate transport system ATP-binding protein